MLCGLAIADRDEIKQVAVFTERATAVQITVPPSLNVTVPTFEGFTGDDVTVAVNEIELPYVLGFELLTIPVEVAALAFTVKVVGWT